MTFEKYPKVENVKNGKKVKRVMNQHPDLFDGTDKWIAQEKLDGANLQVSFGLGSHKLITYKRSGEVGPDEKFYRCHEVMSHQQDEIYDMAEYITTIYSCLMNEIDLCGELFGQGVQKRINYGEQQQFIVNDVKVKGEFISPEILQNHMLELGVFDPVSSLYNWPVFTGTFDMLKNTDVEKLISKYSPSKEIAEGVVIKPADGRLDKGTGSPVMFKKKTARFDDEGGKTKSNKFSDVSNDSFMLHQTLKGFVNENRLLDLFSKHGEIQDEKQIGEYIKLFNEDIQEDFMDEYGEFFKTLSNKEQKYVLNQSKDIVSLIKQYL